METKKDSGKNPELRNVGNQVPRYSGYISLAERAIPSR